MIQVEVNSFLSNFLEKFKTALFQYEIYGTPEWTELLESLTQLINSLETQNELYIDVINASPIDKFGVAEYAIKYINSGFSHRQTADVLTINAGSVITEKDVSYWVNNYSSLSHVKTKQKEVASIFNIQDRMQQIYSELMDHLQEIKTSNKEEFLRAKTTRQQVVLDTYKEIRMLTKDASAILESISHQERLNEFRKVILETIKEISPSTAQAIIRKLKQNKALYTSLLPE